MLRALVTTIRPRQWPKNVFVLAPLVFAQKLDAPGAVARSLLAFVIFTGAACTVYLLNDIIDRERDRLHPLKKDRPLAAGTLSVGAAGIAAVVLAGASTLGAGFLGPRFLLLLLFYLALNVFYSLYLKHIVILDVMTVSLGFVIRVEAGAAVVGVQVSSWILLCTILVALLLSFSKRRHEITLLRDGAADQREVLIQYSPVFLDQMINVVTASTLMSYALWVVSSDTAARFGASALVYSVPFVLFGILRYLYLVYQSPSGRNPTEAVLHDAPFLVNMALWGGIVIAIIYFPGSVPAFG